MLRNCYQYYPIPFFYQQVLMLIPSVTVTCISTCTFLYLANFFFFFCTYSKCNPFTFLSSHCHRTGTNPPKSWSILLKNFKEAHMTLFYFLTINAVVHLQDILCRKNFFYLNFVWRKLDFLKQNTLLQVSSSIISSLQGCKRDKKVHSALNIKQCHLYLWMT